MICGKKLPVSARISALAANWLSVLCLIPHKTQCFQYFIRQPSWQFPNLDGSHGSIDLANPSNHYFARDEGRRRRYDQSLVR